MAREIRKCATDTLKCKVASFQGNCVPKWAEGVLAALRNDAYELLRPDVCRVAFLDGERQIAVLRLEAMGSLDVG